MNKIRESVMIDTEWAINEERGINNSIKNVSSIIYHEVEDNLAKSYLQYDKTHDINYRSCSFNTIAFGVGIKVIAYVYYFKNGENINDKKIGFYGKYNEGKRILTLIMPCVDGYIDNFFFGATIQHELTHHFQSLKNNNESKNKFNYKLYSMCIKMINNKDDVLVSNIGWLIYYWSKHEEEALGNTMYVQLKNYKNEHWQEAYQKTNMYDTICRLKDINSTLRNNHNVNAINTIIYNYLNGFKITYQKIVKISDIVLKRYINRAGKILSLLIDKNILNEGFVYDGIGKDEYKAGDLFKQLENYKKIRTEK